jgi:hypothetical protein
MPTITLTQPAVDRLKPPAKGRVEYWDRLSLFADGTRRLPASGERR